MALDPSNSSSLEQLALKELRLQGLQVYLAVEVDSQR